MKDISEYMPFKNDNILPKISIKSLIGKNIIVHDWKIYDSKYRDGNPSGKFVKMKVETPEGIFYVNTGSGIIMEQLEMIMSAKKQSGESNMDFTCMICGMGRGLKMFPSSNKE